MTVWEIGILLFIVGLLAGFLGGFLGIAGGTFYILIIPYALKFLNCPANEITQYTIANSIFAAFFASTTAYWTSSRKEKNYYKDEILIIALVGGIISILLLKFFVNTTYYSATVFNSVVITLLSYMVIKTFLFARKKQQNIEQQKINANNSAKLGVIGLISGGTSALSGLGGGVIIVPALNVFLKNPIRKAITISSGVIMLTSFAMTMVNLFTTPKYILAYSQGYIVWPISITLALAVLITSSWGVKIAQKASSQTINYVFVIIVGLIIIKKVADLIILSL